MSTLLKPAPHEWSYVGNNPSGLHTCYLCKPQEFPPMPDFHTLCARCGALIRVDELDPMNFAMAVCPPCDLDIRQ